MTIEELKTLAPQLATTTSINIEAIYKYALDNYNLTSNYLVDVWRINPYSLKYRPTSGVKFVFEKDTSKEKEAYNMINKYSKAMANLLFQEKICSESYSNDKYKIVISLCIRILNLLSPDCLDKVYDEDAKISEFNILSEGVVYGITYREKVIDEPEIIYIGLTTRSPVERFIEHRQEFLKHSVEKNEMYQLDYDKIDFIILEHLGGIDEYALEVIEYLYIRLYQPIYNSQGITTQYKHKAKNRANFSTIDPIKYTTGLRNSLFNVKDAINKLNEEIKVVDYITKKIKEVDF